MVLSFKNRCQTASRQLEARRLCLAIVHGVVLLHLQEAQDHLDTRLVFRVTYNDI